MELSLIIIIIIIIFIIIEDYGILCSSNRETLILHMPCMKSQFGVQSKGPADSPPHSKLVDSGAKCTDFYLKRDAWMCPAAAPPYCRTSEPSPKAPKRCFAGKGNALSRGSRASDTCCSCRKCSAVSFLSYVIRVLAQQGKYGASRHFRLLDTVDSALRFLGRPLSHVTGPPRWMVLAPA